MNEAPLFVLPLGLVVWLQQLQYPATAVACSVTWAIRLIYLSGKWLDQVKY